MQLLGSAQTEKGKLTWLYTHNAREYIKIGKSSPAPVDFKGAALAEGEMAKDLLEQQTWANRPDQINPWGTTSWANTPQWDPTTGQNINRWTQSQTLSPALQEALQYQMGIQSGRSELGYGMLGNVAQEIGNPMDWSQFGSMKAPGEAQMMGNAGPNLWGNVQSDMPSYETTGTLRNMDFGGAPGVDAPEFGVQRAEDSIYNRTMSRLQPQLQAEQQQTEIKLRNQGLSPGDEAWKSQMAGLANKANDAYQNASNEAIMGGSQAANNMFGMQTGRRNQYTDEYQRQADFFNQSGQQQFGQQMQAGTQGFQNVMSAAGLQNQARQQAMNEQQGMLGYNQNAQYRQADYYNQLRQQAINEEIARRGQSLNETNALIAGQQVGMPQFGSFNTAGVAQTPQMLQAANMTAQQNAAISSAQNQGINNIMGGVSSIAGMAGMFSDRRLKRNIQRIGERNGIPWYEFEYVWGQKAIGVMADEAPADAVHIHPSGFLMVDYSKV